MRIMLACVLVIGFVAMQGDASHHSPCCTPGVRCPCPEDGAALPCEFRIDLANTCLIAGEKKYVLRIEIDPMLNPAQQATGVYLTPSMKYGRLLVDEVEECPCR